MGSERSSGMVHDVVPLTVGMQVCDTAGEVLGTISHIHGPRSGTSEHLAWDRFPEREILEVRTGLLGLGPH